MDQFIKDIKNDINTTFNNEDFEKEKNAIKQIRKHYLFRIGGSIKYRLTHC